MPRTLVAASAGRTQTVYTSPFPRVTVHPSSVYDTLFVQNPNYNAARTAFIDANSGVAITLGTLRERVDKLAHGLRKNLPELHVGDVICVFSTNHLEYPGIVHGIVRARFVVSPANPSYSVDELVHQLELSGSKAIFVHPNYASTAFAAADRVRIPHNRIFFVASNDIPGDRDKIPKGYSSVMDLATDLIVADDFPIYAQEVTANHSYLCFSSGTTGKSKGVRSSQYNLVSNMRQILQSMETMRMLFPDSVWTGVLPFFHIYGLTFLLHTGPYLSYPVVVYERFDLDLFMTSIARYKVTNAIIVPPILIAISNSEQLQKYDISTLRHFLSGAAPLGKELALLVENRTGIRVSQAYGMTEISPLSHMDAAVGADPDSIGYLAPNMVARLIDPDTGEDVEGNKEGELILRGPNVMLGYLNNEEATGATIDKCGWLHTGDLAVVRAERFYIVDRIKELIKFKGFQVAPAELESHLLSCPEVSDTAVIAHPDREAGELPRAFVVLKPKSKWTARQVREYVDSRVGATKRLRGGVVLVDVIPKSASGKILRRLLRDKDKSLEHILTNGSMWDATQSKL